MENLYRYVEDLYHSLFTCATSALGENNSYKVPVYSFFVGIVIMLIGIAFSSNK